MRLIFCLKTALLCALLMFAFTFASGAQSADYYEKTADEFKNSISGYADGDTAEKAEEVRKAFDFNSIFGAVKDALFSGIKAYSKYFAGICAIVLISAVFGAVNSSFSAYSDVFSFAGVLFLVYFTLIPISSCIETISDSVSRLCAFMASFIPSMGAIYAAGGNTSAAAGNAAVCTCAVTVLQLIGSKFVIPGVKVCVCLASVGALCRKVDLGGVSSFIKNCCMWLSGIVMTLFCGILSIQTMFETSADTLALKGVKFSAARLIPVAGGMVSESLKTVLSGVSFIRATSGACAAAFILYLVIPPICTLAVFKLICSIGSACARLCGLSVQCGYLDSLNGALNILLSVLLCCSASFIIMLAIFIKTAVAI